jgi:hypothetical protein
MAYYDDAYYLVPAVTEENVRVNKMRDVDDKLVIPLKVYVCDRCGGIVADRGVHDNKCPGKPAPMIDTRMFGEPGPNVRY